MQALFTNVSLVWYKAKYGFEDFIAPIFQITTVYSL